MDFGDMLNYSQLARMCPVFRELTQLTVMRAERGIGSVFEYFDLTYIPH